MRAKILLIVMLWLLVLVGAIHAQAVVTPTNTTSTIISDIKEIFNLALQLVTMILAFLAQRSSHHASKKVAEVAAKQEAAEEKSDRKIDDQTKTLINVQKKITEDQTAKLINEIA